MNNIKSQPPRLFLRFFRWFCRPEYLEDIEGDLIERFEKRVKTLGIKKAKKLFIKDVIKLFKPSLIKKFEGNHKLNYYGMFKHNLLVSIRGFKRYKSAFFINLIGLASGLACAMLIYLWVQDEKGIDKFHALDSQLYQVMLNHEESVSINTTTDSPGLMAAALEKEVPEIVDAVQATPSFWFGDMLLATTDKTLKAKGKFVSPKYFELFSFHIIEGNAETVIQAKESIVISKSLALRLFNNTENLIGKTIEWQLLDEKRTFQISGVFEDVPPNSTEEFDFVMAFEVFAELVGKGIHWGNYNAITYVKVVSNTNIDQLNEKLADFVKNKSEGSNVTPFLRKYADGYLYNKFENGIQAGGRIEYINLFSIISIFILLIACINFMNLSTAKASRKTKEVGVKKSLGASRKTLIIQFMEESFLMSLLSIVLAIVLVFLLLPQFNFITDKQIDFVIDLQLLKSIVVIFLVTGLVAGSYPAFYLSKFNPAKVLKGKLKASVGELWVRKGLVVFQFSLSVILIVAVMVVHKQIEFIQNKNLGYDRENLIIFASEGKISDNITTFLERAKNTPGVINASGTSHSIISGGGYTTGLRWEGENPNVKTRFGNMSVLPDFIKTLRMELVEGRGFSNDFETDLSKIIFNEKAIETMGMIDPIGKTVNLWGNDMQIIGVTKNFHFESLHNPISPLFFKIQEESISNIVLRIAPGDQRQTFERVEALYKEFNPDLDFDFQFLDQQYQQQYASENRISMLSRYFAGITVLISCLGLFGLAAFSAEQRFKEIGIRKALGASSFNIINLLSSDFNKIIVVAIAIALPLSYYLIGLWLEGFAYTVELNWTYFIVAGGSALLVAWLTVGFQTFKAARMNPAKSLRSD